jgi:hypothetical protein
MRYIEKITSSPRIIRMELEKARRHADVTASRRIEETPGVEAVSNSSKTSGIHMKSFMNI